jgi:hypothetical protein
MSQTCAIKYGTGTTSHAAPANGTVPVIKYSKNDFANWSSMITPKIIPNSDKIFFIFPNPWYNLFRKNIAIHANKIK